GIDAHDRQVLDRALHVAELARHTLAGKHAARALALAGGTWRARRDRVAVRCAIRREMVALDDPGETLAERDSLHIHLLADLEDIVCDLALDLKGTQAPRGVPT